MFNNILSCMCICILLCYIINQFINFNKYSESHFVENWLSSLSGFHVNQTKAVETKSWEKFKMLMCRIFKFRLKKQQQLNKFIIYILNHYIFKKQ